MDRTHVRRQGLWALAGFTLVVALAPPAAAQTPAAPPTDPNSGNLTLTGIFDTVSTYMFRGIRQNATGIALWPVADLGAAVYTGKGRLKSAGVNIGTWNSLHTGDTGLSLANYYELNGVDHKFGYLSVAGLVTVPISGTTGFGAWSVHGGLELQALGNTTTAFNGGEGHRSILSGGIGFSY